MPESKTHLNVRTFLYRLLTFALGAEHSVGSEQFVYWNASNPKRCVSPDVFVKLGVPNSSFASWKTWRQGGVPELAVEIQSPSDADAGPWEAKLARYRELGVRELVRFDPLAPEGERLHVWDRVDEDLVERVVVDDRAPCLTLGVDWVVRPLAGEPAGLRFADVDGKFIGVPEEVAESARGVAEARARSAEDRIRELEAELARRRDP
jgi:Uma2 family endonuclease